MKYLAAACAMALAVGPAFANTDPRDTTIYRDIIPMQSSAMAIQLPLECVNIALMPGLHWMWVLVTQSQTDPLPEMNQTMEDFGACLAKYSKQ